MSAMPTMIIETNEDTKHLLAYLREIEARLEDGYRKIDSGLEEGQDVTRWERHWLKLLNDYERVYDALVA